MRPTFFCHIALAALAAQAPPASAVILHAIAAALDTPLAPRFPAASRARAKRAAAAAPPVAALVGEASNASISAHFSREKGLANDSNGTVEQLWKRAETAAADWEDAAINSISGLGLHKDADEDHAKDEDHPDGYRLLREEDTVAWVVFFVLFFILLIFDNFILHNHEEALTFGRASAYTVFWLMCAAGFNVYVYHVRGKEDAFAWGTGYLLEWMLSVDNLFVFRSVFLAFGTPDDQKHKPLFWGIVGAIIFRMIFFVIEEVLLHSFAFMHFLLGVFLVYTGIKILTMDEDEEVSPEDNVVIQKITEWVPFVNAYAPTPKFFARIPARGMNGTPRIEALDEMGRPPMKATRLLLVVVCLELTDVVFAVDSVSAIVAQIPDLFLAYTACVFAMLGLRATFFVVDELVKLFSLLSYAVAAILIFIGIKLCLKGWVHIEPSVVCCILVSTLALSMIASVLWDKCGPKEEEDDEKAKERVTNTSQGAMSPIDEAPEDASATAGRA